MGQRLVVELKNGEETIAAVYYHWSAYFGSTIEECALLSKDILKAQKENKDVLEAVLDGLEKRGGGVGVNPKNLKEAEKRFPGRVFKTDVSRNCGLLYFGEEEIQSTIDMGEGLAAIYIDSNEIINDVFYTEWLKIDYFDTYMVIEGARVDILPDEMTMEQCIKLSEFVTNITQQKINKTNIDRG